MKNNITLIRVGFIEHLVDFKKLRTWKSALFKITEVHCIEHLPDSDIDDSYLDQKYTKKKLKSMLSCPSNSDFAVAIMPYPFQDHFYMHRISDNCVVISLYGISEILEKDHISIENFIIKQIYEICAIKYLVSDISSDDVYALVHRDTRGCIFDMNGERTDILYNTEKPIICDSCKDMFKKRQINAKIISTLERELRKIKKPLILRIEREIKRYPLLSIVISGLIAITLNILASYLWELLK
jgi:hypothetical protein